MFKMRFLKTAPLVAALAIASACTPDVMMMTSPNAAIDMMTGTGSVARAPDGRTTFRFVIPADAYAGILDTPEQVEEQNALMLSQWVGRQGICEKGYTVSAPQTVQGMLIYEGACKG